MTPTIEEKQEMDEADKYDPSDRYGHYEGI